MEQDLNCIQKKNMNRGMGVARGTRKPAHNWQVYVGGWLSPPLLCLVLTDDLQGCVLLLSSGFT